MPLGNTSLLETYTLPQIPAVAFTDLSFCFPSSKAAEGQEQGPEESWIPEKRPGAEPTQLSKCQQHFAGAGMGTCFIVQLQTSQNTRN